MVSRFAFTASARAAAAIVVGLLIPAPVAGCGSTEPPGVNAEDAGVPPKCVRRSAPPSPPPHHSVTATTGPDGIAYVVTSNWNATQFYSYDYLSDHWTELTVFPSAGALRLDSVDVQLGRTPTGPLVFFHTGPTSAHQTWVYDPHSDTWSQRADSTVGGGAPPVIQDDATIYSIVSDTTQRGKLVAYDIASDHWSYLAPPPYLVGSPIGLVISGRRIYAAGTADPDLIYDITGNTWSKAPNDPGTNGLGVAAFDGESQVYKIGALCGTTPCTKQLWILDTTTLTWSRGPDLPAPWVIYTPAIYGCDGDVYLFTGPEHAEPMTTEPSQYTLRYHPPTQTWDSSL